MAEKLRVLVIDDSSYNRQAITSILTSEPDIEVVDTAHDGEQGLKLAAQHNPDLITLDIEMPRMDGFTFLRLLMAQRPTPVIVISSHSRKQEVFQALELGALDFIAKPERFFEQDKSPLRRELIAKVRAVRQLQVVSFSSGKARQSVEAAATAPRQPAEPQALEVKRVVCIGASTGGPPALQALFKAMPGGGATAYLVAQHMPVKFTRAFAERLDRLAAVTIKEAEDGEPIRPGWVYIAVGGLHLEVEGGVEGARLRLVEADPEDSYVPSIDRLFTSVARLSGLETMGVVLTGMGTDGSKGVRALRTAGGHNLAESDETAIVYGMPKVAVQTGCVDEELPLGALIGRIHEFVRGNNDGGESGA